MTNQKHNYIVKLPFSEAGKEAYGTLEEFTFALSSLANAHAPNTIKSHFRKETILPHAENGDTLYLLAKGVFNGKHYTCFATSGDKYINENYVIQVSDSPYKMYKD
jgi:hypothetical protein